MEEDIVVSLDKAAQAQAKETGCKASETLYHRARDYVISIREMLQDLRVLENEDSDFDDEARQKFLTKYTLILAQNRGVVHKEDVDHAKGLWSAITSPTRDDRQS